MVRKLSAALMAAAVLSVSSSALATGKVWRILPTFTAHDKIVTGRCPHEVDVYGSIKVIGNLDPHDPVLLEYQYLRSDGFASVVFKTSIVQALAPDGHHASIGISDGWPEPGPFYGWERVKAWPANQPDFPPAYSKKTFVRFLCTVN